MDDILERFNAIKWLLEQRIAEVARKRGPITYSDLIRGVTFTLSHLKDGQHRIDPAEWQELDRAIIGDFLGYLSMRSYQTAKAMYLCGFWDQPDESGMAALNL